LYELYVWKEEQKKRLLNSSGGNEFFIRVKVCTKPDKIKKKEGKRKKLNGHHASG
jgi:tRNA(Glu) U13 pseudouridine synthase TruD